MHSQSTYKELLSCSPGVLSAHQRKDSWFGGWWWVFPLFSKDRELPTCSLPETRDSEPSPAITQQRSLSETRHVAPGAPTARPLPHCGSGQDRWKGGRSVRREQPHFLLHRGQLAGQGGGLLTQGPASGHPAQGHPRSPLCSSGRRPCCSQRACRPERVRGRAPGLLRHVTNWITASAWISSPVQQGVGPGDFQQGCMWWTMNNKNEGL